MPAIKKRELVRLVRNYKSLQHDDVKKGKKKLTDARCVLMGIKELQDWINEIADAGADGVRIYYCSYPDQHPVPRYKNIHSVALVATHQEGGIDFADWIEVGTVDDMVKALLLEPPAGVNHGSPSPPDTQPGAFVMQCADDSSCLP